VGAGWWGGSGASGAGGGTCARPPELVPTMFAFGAPRPFSPVVWGAFMPRRSELCFAIGLASIAYRVWRLDQPRDYLSTLRLCAAPAILLLCFMQVLNAAFVPLIYFKF